MHNKRVFVSGGAGVIGNALVDLLLEKGAEVFVGDLKSCPVKWFGKVRYFHGDLNGISSQLLRHFDPHYFFHLAATFERSEESYPFIDENYHHNVQLSHYLLSCLKEAPSLEKVVFASSYLIYDPALYLTPSPPQKPVVLRETDAISPRNLCGSAKLFHEEELHFLDHFLGDKFSSVSARIFRVYGQGSRDIISRWIRSALNNEPLTLYGSEQFFDYIYASDVAEGLVKLAESSYRGHVNLGSGKARKVSDIVSILEQHFTDLKVNKEPLKGFFEASEASIQQLVSLTGWAPLHSLERAIPLLIAYEKERKESIKEVSDGVLITSISKKIPLISAVREAALRIGKFKHIFGSDSSSDVLGRYEVDQFWKCAPLDNLEIEEVINFCQDNHIKAIIPTRDGDLHYYAQHQEALKNEGIETLVSSKATIDLCQDKLRFSEVLHQNNFPVIPSSLSLDSFDGVMRFVVKEQKGAGSENIAINVSREEAVDHSRKLKNPIFQPFIEGKEWSIDAYRSLDGKSMGAVARVRELIIAGESQVTATAHYPELETLCITLAEELNIIGPAVFQVIQDANNQLHVIECNPRFGGASTASITVGLDTFFWFFMECEGMSLINIPFNRSEGEIRQIRILTDKIQALPPTLW